MNTILDEIIQYKYQEVAALKTGISLDVLKNKIVKKSVAQFRSSLLHPRKGTVAIIAEVKMRSPSHGDFISSPKQLVGEEKLFFAMQETERRVKAYTEGGGDAISIVTDEKYFGGHSSLITTARNITRLPILQKDFIIDEFQIYYSAFLGADAILLIARVLDEATLQQFVALSLSLGVEPVVEVYDKADLEKALATKASVIGVNARNLQNFSVDIEEACRIGKMIPNDRLFIGFSGVKSRVEVEKYKLAGAKAVLVGSSIMEAEDPAAKIKELLI